MSARVMCRRSSAIRLNASDCVRPSVPDVSLMSWHNYTNIRKCVFPNTGQGWAILLELLGRKLLQYFHVSKRYYLTLIQESYTVCGYKFINNVLPSILTKTLQNSAEARNTQRMFSESLWVSQTNSRIIFQIRLRLFPLPHALQFILASDGIQFKLFTATLKKLHIKIITNSKKEPYETTKCNSIKPQK